MVPNPYQFTALRQYQYTALALYCGAAEHAAGEGGVAAPAGVTGDQPQPGDGGGGLGKSLAGVWTKIQMLDNLMSI